MTMRKYYYYLLKDPRNNEIRYVGMTTKPKDRYSVHIYNSAHGLETNAWKAEWIGGLLKEGLRPVLEVIETTETTSPEEAQEHEERLITTYFLNGCRLVNVMKSPLPGSNPGGVRKAVYQYDKQTGEFIAEYPSRAEASRVLGLATSALWVSAMSEGEHSHGGYLWSYVKQDRINVKEIKIGRPGQKVLATNRFTGEECIFDSTVDAASVLGVHPSNISRVCNGLRKYAGDYIFCYM